MEKLQLRLTPGEADMIAGTMLAAMGECIATAPDEEVSAMIARLRNLVAKARLRAVRAEAG